MIRLIMKRPAIGVALAWLILVTTIPYAGALIYLIVGEGGKSNRMILECYIPLSAFFHWQARS